MRRTLSIILLIAIASAAQAAQRRTPAPQRPAAIQRVLPRFKAAAIRAHTRYLSSDLLEGRAPGTRGDELTAAYIAAQFESYGLEPAGDDGTYFQRVPLVGVTLESDRSNFLLQRGTEAIQLQHLADFAAGNQTQKPQVTVDSDLVFVGHGVVAPEYDWDDFKGIDVRGKTLVMLADDPPATEVEPDLFKGKARTYYGRWTYKFEIAAARGAVAAILIHTNESAGYGWQVIQNSWARERSYVKREASDANLELASWIARPAAERMMKLAGHDFDALRIRAHRRDFQPVSLNVRLRANITSSIRPIITRNVVARLRGTHPQLSRQAVLYTAHHDHLGIGKAKNGDTIYNGAIDNATGCGVLLELARVWASAQRPKRTILFATVAAEEQGLLGSEYLARHPAVPAGSIALALNFDSVQQHGRVRDVTLIGVERTTFHARAKRIASGLGLRIDPDENPEQGSYYRSDHFSLARVGVPSFSIDLGTEYVGKSKEWSDARSKDFSENHYHQPSDEFDPSWDFSAGVQVAQLGFWLGWEAATMEAMPEWVAGDEFAKIRRK